MITLYHGTNCDIERFDMSKVQPYNIGLHFGSWAAARERINYLNECGEQGPFTVLECQLDVNRPFRIDDVFGHSYAMVLDALQGEVDRGGLSLSPLQSKTAALIDEYMGIEDDLELVRDKQAYRSYCQRLNIDIVNIFCALGYDALVYKNEIEDDGSAADSYVIFDDSRVEILGKESVVFDGINRCVA